MAGGLWLTYALSVCGIFIICIFQAKSNLIEIIMTSLFAKMEIITLFQVEQLMLDPGLFAIEFLVI